MIKEKMDKCEAFFNELAEALKGTYVIFESRNKDCSKYLIPVGTENQVTYYGKPVRSFRFSDHWNWKTSTKNNPNERYIQCFSKDLPWTKQRKGEGLASDPIHASSVCFYGNDGLYHVVYGEIFDRKKKTWSWIEKDVTTVIVETIGASKEATP